ncbi:MAG TPA: helix-turn-helix transcriptional regulator [Acidimicrobiales bacterium]|nr:helix-turn-helix transcriptional regulator [Acidimicrobiales bacterium]
MATAGSGSEALASGAEVGAALREARERLGASLGDISGRTGVPCQHLEALESMDLTGLSDQRTVVTAARRYSEVLGLDPSEVCGTALRAWQDAHWSQDTHSTQDAGPATGRAQGTRATRRRREASSPSSPAPRVTGAGNGSSQTPRGFTHTAEVPLAGLRHPAVASSVHFADTGPIWLPWHAGGYSRRLAPRWLRVTVTVTALLLLIGIGGLAIHHYEPQWLADIHLTRTNSTGGAATGSTSSGSGSRSGSASASHARASIVTQSSGGASAASVVVRAKSYQVAIAAQEPCWIDATVASSPDPVFAGVLQAGQTKVLDPVGGHLSVEFGASLVVVGVQVSGKAVPGWLFQPHTVPFTLNFSSSGT